MVDANSESVPISSDCRAAHLHAAHPLHRAHVVLLKIGAKKLCASKDVMAEARR